ncbi:MAG: hypothetical protein AB7S92_18205 [Parvibaculaceae bacterium]
MLLRRLSRIRTQAEAAHLEIVVSSGLVAQLEQEGRDLADARLKLLGWKMREQKLLRELDWILDELDRLDAGRKPPGYN